LLEVLRLHRFNISLLPVVAPVVRITLLPVVVAVAQADIAVLSQVKLLVLLRPQNRNYPLLAAVHLQ
jgi:hypothetical protein